jgi:nitrate/nitrite transporter NarK
VLFVVAICFSYMTVGSYFVIFPTQSSRMYGKKNGASVYGLLSLGVTGSNFTQLILMTTLKQSIMMKEVFIIFFGSTVVAFVLMMVTKTKINWEDVT